MDSNTLGDRSARGTRIRRLALPAAAAAAALLLAACGSSGTGGGGSTTSAAPTTVAGPSSQSSASVGSSASAAPSTSSSSSSTSAGSASSESSSAGTVASGAVMIEVKNYKFTPTSVTVKPGTKVTWKFDDPADHNVTSMGGDSFPASTNLNNGGTYSYTFTKAGSYPYICTIHAYMHGTVIVK